MIVVTIQIHPDGDASKAFPVGVMQIASISGLASTSSYKCWITTTGDKSLEIEPY